VSGVRIQRREPRRGKDDVMAHAATIGAIGRHAKWYLGPIRLTHDADGPGGPD
jgi:hypothetical protein